MSMLMRSLTLPLEDDYDIDAYDEADDMPDVVETRALPQGFSPLTFLFHCIKIRIPIFNQLEIEAPIIVAACKMDLKDEDTNLDSERWRFKQIKNVVKFYECSASSLNKIHKTKSTRFA
ncbi:hypothetical protein FEM48_Zijuj07G0086900 [Ziziphus jujuba var. spinosa]|uniref:Uncharacterized protein n=1 Tax=Ziziphus jujuba var. spinosa TaxID=714518 RepID=A0A978V3M2_ZIZJJ|nr:hypothetical protein FEM48_Zijuj07G0086900 [Ziziphus jujuba var. spinosa]